MTRGGWSSPRDFLLFMRIWNQEEMDFNWKNLPKYIGDAHLGLVEFSIVYNKLVVPLCVQFRMPNNVIQLAHRVFGIFILGAALDMTEGRAARCQARAR